MRVRARACARVHARVCARARAQANDRRWEEVGEVHVLSASCWPRVLPPQNNGRTVDFESPHKTSVWVAAEVGWRAAALERLSHYFDSLSLSLTMSDYV